MSRRQHRFIQIYVMKPTVPVFLLLTYFSILPITGLLSSCVAKPAESSYYQQTDSSYSALLATSQQYDATTISVEEQLKIPNNLLISLEKEPKPVTFQSVAALPSTAQSNDPPHELTIIANSRTPLHQAALTNPLKENDFTRLTITLHHEQGAIEPGTYIFSASKPNPSHGASKDHGKVQKGSKTVEKQQDNALKWFTVTMNTLNTTRFYAPRKDHASTLELISFKREKGSSFELSISLFDYFNRRIEGNLTGIFQ